MKEKRPNSLQGLTYKTTTGCGDLFVTVNDKEDKPFEVFVTMGKGGGCASAQSEAIGRLASLCFRSGIEYKDVIKQLIGISCHSMVVVDGEKVLSCADAISKLIKIHIEGKGEKNGEC